jgi:hypothetical protein
MIKRIRDLSAAVAALAFLFSFSPAEATTVAATPFACTVSDVGWDGRVFIDCTNTTTRFYSFSSVACSSGTITHAMDDMKMFEQLAVAALLSGKSLSITFDRNCEAQAGTNVGPIQTLALVK